MNFLNPVDITIYPGARSELLKYSQGLNVLIFCTEGMLARLNKDNALGGLLGSRHIQFEHNFTSNPSLKDMMLIADKYFSKEIDAIWGIGGGSTMDVAKIASVTLPSRRLNYSLVQLLDQTHLLDEIAPIDCFQIPTTAGTGSEVTPFATVWDYESGLKKSLSHTKMFANKAIIDSEFLNKIPLDIALSTGLDALNQALESIWNKNSNELTRTIAVKSSVSSLRGLRRLDELGHDITVADNLAMGSLLAGLCISQTRTAICHSISYPLTLKFGMPHGLACAFSMLDVLNFNSALVKDEIDAIEHALESSSLESVIFEIFEKYGFYSRIREYMTSTADIVALLPEMVAPGRAGNNIRNISDSDLKDVVVKSCLRAFIAEI